MTSNKIYTTPYLSGCQTQLSRLIKQKWGPWQLSSILRTAQEQKITLARRGLALASKTTGLDLDTLASGHL